MAEAYILINCEIGTFGAYDILAKIESPQVEDLRETITWKIRKIDKIRSTLTLMGIEGQS